MKYFLLGILVTLLIIPLAGFLYIRSSYMSVAATDSPLPFEKFLAGMALRDRIQLEAPQRDVSGFTTADLVTGAQVFRKNCAFCHGLPQQPASIAGSEMFPHAPQLFTPKGSVSDDPAGVTYWKINNGIRLTGMPSFKAALTDQQMWQASALLAHDDKLPPEVQDALKPVAAAASVSPRRGLTRRQQSATVRPTLGAWRPLTTRSGSCGYRCTMTTCACVARVPSTMIFTFRNRRQTVNSHYRVRRRHGYAVGIKHA